MPDVGLVVGFILTLEFLGSFSSGPWVLSWEG
jgi:hypothetical protein